MSNHGSTPPDFTALREEARRIGRTRDLAFRVLFALLVGSSFAFLIYRGLYATYKTSMDRQVVRAILTNAGIWCFIGGFFSGWIVEFEVRHRRWRFLWLAVTSPATATWFLAVRGAVTQRHISNVEAILLIIMFVSALAGSAVGYRAVYRQRMRERRKWGDRRGDLERGTRRTER